MSRNKPVQGGSHFQPQWSRQFLLSPLSSSEPFWADELIFFWCKPVFKVAHILEFHLIRFTLIHLWSQFYLWFPFVANYNSKSYPILGTPKILMFIYSLCSLANKTLNIKKKTRSKNKLESLNSSHFVMENY